MNVPLPAPERTGRALRGDRALAIRIIAETGDRAARRSPGRPVPPGVASGARRRIDELLDRAPRDVVRRGGRRIDRFFVRHAGGVLLALRRPDVPDDPER